VISKKFVNLGNYKYMIILFWAATIIFTIVYAGILFYLLYALYAMISGAPFVPTSHEKVKKMIDMVDLKEHERFIDLGSGDGRLVLAATQHCKHATGVEISPLLYWTSRTQQLRKHIKNATFIRDTLWNIDLASYDVVSIYFIPHWMKKLEKKIKQEMKPGSRIISHAFTFPGWRYQKKDDTIYMYYV